MSDAGDRASAGTTLAPRHDVVYRDLDGGAVLLDLTTGGYFGLNAVGALIWSALDGRRSVDDIVEHVHRRTSGTPPDLRSEVEAFVRQLISRDLVRPAQTVGVGSP